MSYNKHMNTQPNHELTQGSHPHIESKHDGSEAVFCLVHGGECGVTVEIRANPEEQKVLEEALLTAMEQLDQFFEGRFAELFKGLEIEVGDNLTAGGGEAFGEDNKVVLDRKKMLMTIRDADTMLAENGEANQGDKLRAVPESLHDMSAAVYEVVHEIGHIVEERADIDLPKDQRLKRATGLTDKSPTNLYMQDPHKPQEAFAEGFAHKVFGNQIDPELDVVVAQGIDDFCSKLQLKSDQVVA